MNIWDNLKLPKIIFQTQSPFNGSIEVWQVGEHFKVVVNGTVQSVDWASPSASRMVWGRMVEVLKEQAPEIKNSLILGLGGGAMQHLIAKAFPGIHLVSVEIDEKMVEVAKNYFRLEDIPNHTVIVEDAFRIVVEPEKHGLQTQSFDSAIVDIYCGEKFPDLARSGNFFASLKNLVRPGGLVLFNRIYLQSHQYEVDAFIEELGEFFTNIDSVTVAGKTNSDNIIIFGRV